MSDENVPGKIKVKATREGYYGDMLRKVGTIFYLIPFTLIKKGVKIFITAEEQFSHSWMETIDNPTPPLLRSTEWEESVMPPPPPSALPQQPSPLRAPDAPADVPKAPAQQDAPMPPTGDKEVI